MYVGARVDLHFCLNDTYTNRQVQVKSSAQRLLCEAAKFVPAETWSLSQASHLLRTTADGVVATQPSSIGTPAATYACVQAREYACATYRPVSASAAVAD